MGNFNAARSFIYIAGNVIDPFQNNTNENTIYGQHNASIHQITGHGHTGAVGDGPVLTPAAVPFITSLVVPLGSVIPWYDFAGILTYGAGPGFTVDNTHWQYCDGSLIANAGPLNAQNTPDLSGRVIIGYGTDGGGNNGSAAWNAAPLGTANNLLNLQHVHDMGHGHAFTQPTVDAHTHTMPHTHDVNIAAFNSADESAHTHSSGTLSFQTLFWDDGVASFALSGYDNAGASLSLLDVGVQVAVPGVPTSGGVAGMGPTVDTNFYTGAGAGSTGAGTAHNHSIDPPNTTSSAASTATTSNASVNTTSGGAVTAFAGNTANAVGGPADWTQVNITPRSIRFRYLMRIL